MENEAWRSFINNRSMESDIVLINGTANKSTHKEIDLF